MIGKEEDMGNMRDFIDVGRKFQKSLLVCTERF